MGNDVSKYGLKWVYTDSVQHFELDEFTNNNEKTLLLFNELSAKVDQIFEEKEEEEIEEVEKEIPSVDQRDYDSSIESLEPESSDHGPEEPEKAEQIFDLLKSKKGQMKEVIQALNENDIIMKKDKEWIKRKVHRNINMKYYQFIRLFKDAIVNQDSNQQMAAQTCFIDVFQLVIDIMNKLANQTNQGYIDIGVINMIDFYNSTIILLAQEQYKEQLLEQCRVVRSYLDKMYQNCVLKRRSKVSICENSLKMLQVLRVEDEFTHLKCQKLYNGDELYKNQKNRIIYKTKSFMELETAFLDQHRQDHGENFLNGKEHESSDSSETDTHEDRTFNLTQNRVKIDTETTILGSPERHSGKKARSCIKDGRDGRDQLNEEEVRLTYTQRKIQMAERKREKQRKLKDRIKYQVKRQIKKDIIRLISATMEDYICMWTDAFHARNENILCQIRNQADVSRGVTCEDD